MSQLYTPIRQFKPPVGARVNPLHPLARGLVQCLLLNEGNGQILTDALTQITTPLTAATWIQTPDGGAAVFDGSTAFGIIPFNSFTSSFGTGPFTVEMIIYPQVVSGFQIILGKEIGRAHV
jgi:hypothetical protein